MIKAKGMIFMEADEIAEMVKTENGKKKLEKLNYRPVRWHIKNPVTDPFQKKNRYERRHVIVRDMYGFMRNNEQDRTKKKEF